MCKINTLYSSYQEFLLDIDIYGKIVSTPTQSLASIEEMLFEEFKLSKPLPTLEDKRYELSRLVEESSHIEYVDDLTLQDDEEVVDLLGEAGGSFSPPDFTGLDPLIPEVQAVFAYENAIHDDLRQSIIEKYDLATGEEFSLSIDEVEKTVGSVKEDTSTVLSDEQIDMLGQVKPDVFYDQASSDNSLVEYEESSEDEDEEDDFYEDEYEEEYDEEEYSEDEEEYSEEDSYEDEYEEEYSEDEEDDYEEEYSEDEEEYSEEDSYEDEEDDYEEEYSEDEEEYVEENSAEDFEEYEEEDAYEEENSDEDDYSEEVEEDEYDEDEDYEEEYTDEVEEEDFDEEGYEEEYIEEPVEEHRDEGQKIGGTAIQASQPFESDIELSSDDFISDTESFVKPVQEESKPKPSEPSTPVNPMFSSPPVQEPEPTDLRRFLLKHPRSEISFVLQYFTKKQVEDAIKTGKVIKRGTRLKAF